MTLQLRLPARLVIYKRSHQTCGTFFMNLSCLPLFLSCFLLKELQLHSDPVLKYTINTLICVMQVWKSTKQMNTEMKVAFVTYDSGSEPLPRRHCLWWLKLISCKAISPVVGDFWFAKVVSLNNTVRESWTVKLFLSGKYLDIMEADSTPHGAVMSWPRESKGRYLQGERNVANSVKIGLHYFHKSTWYS